MFRRSARGGLTQATLRDRGAGERPRKDLHLHESLGHVATFQRVAENPVRFHSRRAKCTPSLVGGGVDQPGIDMRVIEDNYRKPVGNRGAEGADSVPQPAKTPVRRPSKLSCFPHAG
jgi:hypothetical protein